MLGKHMFSLLHVSSLTACQQRQGFYGYRDSQIRLHLSSIFGCFCQTVSECFCNRPLLCGCVFWTRVSGTGLKMSLCPCGLPAPICVSLCVLHVLCLPSDFISALCESGTLPCHTHLFACFRLSALKCTQSWTHSTNNGKKTHIFILPIHFFVTVVVELSLSLLQH